MRRERSEDLLHDILDFIAKIEDWAPSQGTPDEKTLFAILHALQYIGEAVSRLPTDVTSAAPEIPWVKIRAMRNLIAHDYAGIDPDIIRKTVQDRLPELKAAANRLLATLT